MPVNRPNTIVYNSVSTNANAATTAMDERPPVAADPGGQERGNDQDDLRDDLVEFAAGRPPAKQVQLVEMSARLVPVLQNLRRKLRRDWLGRDQSQLRSEGLWDELNKVPRYVFANEAGRIDDHANIAERF